METPTAPGCSTGREDRLRSGRSTLVLALLLTVLLGTTLLPAAAYVSTTVVVDGTLTDWTPVLAAAGNAVADGQGADDPDNPGTQSRDLDNVASTWDANNLYLYFRRTTIGNNSVSYIAYIDRDGDDLLESTDMVARFDFNGSSYAGSSLSWYRPSNAAGDAMGGDGVDLPGSEGTAVTGTSLLAAGATNGIEIEARISWTSLRLPSDSGLRLHFSSGTKAGLPGAVEDNTGVQSLRRVAVLVTPDRNYGTASDSAVTYWHTVKNTGNATDTFTYSTASSQNWVVESYGPDGVTPSSGATLAPGASTTVMLRVIVPNGTAKGTEDITAIQVRSSLDPSVVGQATDITFVGPVTVTPPRSGSMAPGGVVEYVHTVRNNTGGAGDILLSASSASGWQVRIYADDGTTELSRLDGLADGASANIIVKMTVPATATIGAKEAITVTGVKAGDPDSDGTAIDDTTISKPFTIAPNNSGISGPNATAQYFHTITNSWMASRTIDLVPSSSQTWTVSVFEENGVTPFTSAELGPFGGTRNIVVRVTVPGTAPSSTVDVTTIGVRYAGSIVATATDRTTVGKLATYATAGYVDASDSFHPGDTVYARGMGLTGINSVRFRWSDTAGIVYTSPPVAVDINRMAASSYALATDAAIGTWTLDLLNATSGAVVSSRTFTVSSDTWISLTIDTDFLSFGTLDPELPSPVRTVSVTVDASGPYDLSKTKFMPANVDLSIAGAADGRKLGGIRTFSDNYQAIAHWAAPPGAVSGNVQYTAVLAP